jgi:hypothetical protein
MHINLASKTANKCLPFIYKLRPRVTLLQVLLPVAGRPVSPVDLMSQSVLFV